VTRDEYILWLAKQKPNFVQVFPDKDPANQAKTDTTAKTAAATINLPAAGQTPETDAKLVAQKN
jgi:cytochrome c oxidase subunit II